MQIQDEHASDFFDGKFDPELEASYYTNRSSAITYFFVNGVLFTLVVYSLANALQHPDLYESELNVVFTVISVASCFAFDRFVLLRDNKVEYYTWGVNFTIFLLLTGYIMLQSSKQPKVRQKLGL